VLLALVAGARAELSSQSLRVSGRVLRGGAAARPLAGTWVVLHRVAMDGAGRPIDSTRTDGAGRFTLALARPERGAVYVASTWYSGVVYFSEPLAGAARGAATLSPLYVYDTSSIGPVRLARRVVTIARQRRDGTHAVLELLDLENPAWRTRIAADTLRPTWAGALPAAALQLRLGQGDLSPEAVTRRGDSVVVFAPIPPVARKQLSYAYVLPADLGSLSLPIDQATGELDLLLEDTAATVRAASLDSLGIEELQGRRFARYRMRDVAVGARLAIALPAAPARPQALVPLIVAVAALVLAVAFVIALRRRPVPLAPSVPAR
jgi:hypothetical protein